MPIRLPCNKPWSASKTQHPGKYLPMRFHVDQPACARRYGRVIRAYRSSRAMPRKRRRLSESFKRQAMPRSASMPSKYPVISETEIDARRQPRTAQLIGIEPGALLLNESVEALAVEYLVQNEHRRDGPDQQPYLRTPTHKSSCRFPDSCAYPSP